MKRRGIPLGLDVEFELVLVAEITAMVRCAVMCWSALESFTFVLARSPVRRTVVALTWRSVIGRLSFTAAGRAPGIGKPR
jgi:hypothetical protein